MYAFISDKIGFVRKIHSFQASQPQLGEDYILASKGLSKQGNVKLQTGQMVIDQHVLEFAEKNLLSRSIAGINESHYNSPNSGGYKFFTGTKSSKFSASDSHYNSNTFTLE